MGELEEKTAAVPEVEKKWADARAEFAQYEKDAADRLERLKADQIDTQAALAKSEADIPAKNRPTYDQFVKAHGPDAFAAVKDRVCQGCRSGLTQQKVIELSGGVFSQCPSCGKMIYPAAE